MVETGDSNHHLYSSNKSLPYLALCFSNDLRREVPFVSLERGRTRSPNSMPTRFRIRYYSGGQGAMCLCCSSQFHACMQCVDVEKGQWRCTQPKLLVLRPISGVAQISCSKKRACLSFVIASGMYVSRNENNVRLCSAWGLCADIPW